jgi:putative ABC transport system permease protein
MTRPPRLARLLVRFFASRERNEAYLGDLEEMYVQRLSKKDVPHPRRWYWREVFGSLPVYVRDNLSWSFGMFKNYFKTAFRALKRHRAYSILNIVGLAAGITCALLIWLWVQDELGFDKFHKNAKTLYRVEREGQNPSTPYPMAPAIKAEIPEVANVTRTGNPGTVLVQAGERSFYENTIRAVDPAFLTMFTFPLVRGDAAAVLSNPFSIVISWDMADKYFPGRDPIGQSLTANKEFVFTVTGVMKNPPTNSSLRPHFLVSVDRMDDLRNTRSYWKNINRWDLGAFQTWVELRNPATAASVGEKITAIYNSHTQWAQGPRKLMPLVEIRLAQSRSQVLLFSGLALFVLLVACINFMNLATARATSRAKEIGLRKVVGAFRKHIIAQFYGETFLTTLLAVLAAAVLFIVLFPAFQRIAGKEIGLGAVLNWRFGLGILTVILLTGFFAGSYPALLLSALHPAKTLKGEWRAGRRAASFRKILVVFQFALSAFLLISTGIISRQVNYMRTMNVGYDKDNLITVALQDDTAKTYATLKNELREETLIAGVTASFQLPTDNGMQETGTRWEGIDLKTNPYVFYDAVDYDYAETLGLGLAAGRSFSRTFGSDEGGAFLVNERQVKQMKLASAEEALGKTLSSWGKTGPIVGVLKDYHFQSAQNVIEPQVIFCRGDQWGGRNKLSYAMFRLKGGLIREGLSRIHAAWTRVNPGHPFDYRFFDEAFDTMYRSDERLGTMIKYFALMAVLIAGLGLIGLASFTAAQRTKEIGVRKVLGASSPRIAGLLVKEFLVWVSAANILAWPAAFFIMNKWLEKYAFRPGFGWWLFLAAAGASLAVAIVAVGYQAFRAALANPVESLKYE